MIYTRYRSIEGRKTHCSVTYNSDKVNCIDNIIQRYYIYIYTSILRQAASGKSRTRISWLVHELKVLLRPQQLIHRFRKRIDQRVSSHTTGVPDPRKILQKTYSLTVEAGSSSWPRKCSPSICNVWWTAQRREPSSRAISARTLFEARSGIPEARTCTSSQRVEACAALASA